jgi:hypothetical protein
MLGKSSVAIKLAASQQGLCSMGLTVLASSATGRVGTGMKCL